MCVYIYIYIIYTGPILEMRIWGMGMFFGAHLLEKGHFLGLHFQRMPFLTISNELFFLKLRLPDWV